MALTLLEAAKLARDEIQRGVVETFIIESPLLDRLPLIPIEGNSWKYNEEATLPGVEFRAVNTAYVESTGTVNQKSEAIVPLGGDADVDKFIVRTRGNLNDQRAVQLSLKVKAWAHKYQDTCINGDVVVDANSFDGLKKRLTGASVIDAGTNGIPIVGTTENERHAFFDKLDELIAAVVPDVAALYMNKAIRAKIMSAGRRLGGVEWITAVFLDGDQPVQKRIPTYNAIPMLDIGKKADGTYIIPVTETQGTATDASSIYALAFSEDEEVPGVAGLFNGPSEDEPFEVTTFERELESKPAYRVRVEGFVGLAVFGKGAARLRGARNA